MEDTDLFASFPQLETKNLILREITYDDAPALYQIFSDVDVTRYWSCLPYQSIDDANKLIGSIIDNYKNRRAIEWGVVAKHDRSGVGKDRVIGKCAFHEWLRDHYRAEVGYALARDCWGKGMMMEALPAVLDFGFNGMKLHSIEARVDPDNVASIELLKKLRFRQEGYLKESYFMAGKFNDTVVFSLLKKGHFDSENGQ